MQGQNSLLRTLLCEGLPCILIYFVKPIFLVRSDVQALHGNRVICTTKTYHRLFVYLTQVNTNHLVNLISEAAIEAVNTPLVDLESDVGILLLVAQESANDLQGKLPFIPEPLLDNIAGVIELKSN